MESGKTGFLKELKKKYGHRIKVLILVVCMLVTSILGQSICTHAMTPRVMMTEYSIDKSDIYPGDTFTLKFTLRNTSKYKIMNLKCTLSTEKGEFLPVDGVGTGYLEEIAGESEEEMSFKLESIKGLSEKPYTIKVKTEYEDWDGSYSAEDKIYVPIRLKSEILVSDTYIAEEEIRLGDNIEIVSTINNIGSGDIYKVTASVTGHNIADATSYIGNIKSGKNANVDIITKATAHDDSRDATEYDNDLLITYEDKEGNKYTETQKLGKLNVLEQDFSDVIKIKEDDTKHLSEVNKLEIVIGIIVVIIIVLFVRRMMKRKKLEKNFD